MPSFKPSKYQKDIYKEYNTTRNNIFISAGPGSGKTATIVELINQKSLSKKAIMLAFNKSIQQELEKRVPKDVETATLHSLGMKLLRKHLNCKIKVNQLKSFVWGKKLFGDFLEKKYKKNEKDKNIHLFTLARLVDLQRMNMKSLTEIDLLQLSDDFSVGAGPIEILQAVQLGLALEKYNNSHSELDEFIIDFTDMIYLPVSWINQVEFPRYDEVFIDEIQDLNKMQKVLVDRLIGKAGRFIAVGDERQSIYNFAGSTLEQLNAFKNAKRTTILPLSVSYRCSKKIVEEANKIFPGLEYAEGADEGSVRYGTIDEIKPNDFVICRNNMPLIENYISMMSSGKKSYILGKDFGKSLSALLIKIDKIEDLDTILSEKRDKIKEKGHPSPENSIAYQTLLEKVLILRALYNRFNDFESMKTIIEDMFAEEGDIPKDSVMLMSGHKSKGLEANRVVWISPELIPSKYARTETELYAEKCLKYVIITRAKKELIIVRGGGECPIEDNQDIMINNLKSL